MTAIIEPKCPICAASVDGKEEDFGRAYYFSCENKHDFIVRADTLQALVKASDDDRERIGLECEKRNDDFIAQISSSEGRPLVELVPRSNWQK